MKAGEDSTEDGIKLGHPTAICHNYGKEISWSTSTQEPGPFRNAEEGVEVNYPAAELRGIKNQNPAVLGADT